MDDFDAKLQAFVAKVTADLATYYTANFPSLAPSIADPRWGQKYVKVDVVNDGEIAEQRLFASGDGRAQESEECLRRARELGGG